MKNETVTIAKAIGILLMVLGHARCPLPLQQFIYMFHMPLFFFLSGYCFKEKYLLDKRSFILKRVKGLYVPFVKWSLLFLVLHNLFFYLNIYNDVYGFEGKVSHLYTLKEHIIKAVHLLTAMRDNEQLLGGYWFLKQLFCASIICLYTIKYVKNAIIGGSILLTISFFLLLSGVSVPYFGISSLTFFSASFFMMGYILSKHKLPSAFKFTVFYGVVVLIGAICCPSTILSYTPISFFPYWLCAIGGTLMTFNLSSYIAGMSSNWQRFFVFVGNNTLPILTWHFLCFKVVSLLIIVIYGLPIENLAHFPVILEYANKGWWVAYMVVGAGIPLLFCMKMNNNK